MSGENRISSLLKEIKAKKFCYLAIIPTLFLLAMFSYIPFSSALFHSFFEWDGFGSATWIALDNFKEIFQDRVFFNSLGNMLKLLVFRLVVTLSIPLVVAELIYNLRGERKSYVYRVLFVIPMVLPMIVIILIWQFIYDANIGILNQLLKLIGLSHFSRAWLGDPKTALYSIMGVGFPWVDGFCLLIYYAGLQNIPSSLIDAAKIDGVTIMQRIFHIDLPLIMGQIKMLFVLTCIFGVQDFVRIMILTDGGPGYATMVPGLWMFQNARIYNRMGYASAIGVIMLLVILGLTYLNMRYMKSSVEEIG